MTALARMCMHELHGYLAWYSLLCTCSVTESYIVGESGFIGPFTPFNVSGRPAKVLVLSNRLQVRGPTVVSVAPRHGSTVGVATGELVPLTLSFSSPVSAAIVGGVLVDGSPSDTDTRLSADGLTMTLGIALAPGYHLVELRADGGVNNSSSMKLLLGDFMWRFLVVPEGTPACRTLPGSVGWRSCNVSDYAAPLIASANITSAGGLPALSARWSSADLPIGAEFVALSADFGATWSPWTVVNSSDHVLELPLLAVSACVSLSPCNN